MSRAILWCPHTGIEITEHITKEAFQARVDEAYARFTAGGHTNPNQFVPIAPQLKVTCRFWDLVDDREIQHNHTEWKNWPETAAEYRRRLATRYTCRTHNAAPQMFFTYAAWQKRYNDVVAERFVTVHVSPTGIQINRANPYWYRWQIWGAFPKRPKPKAMHDIFAMAGMAPA